jgi:hypothetical protein
MKSVIVTATICLCVFIWGTIVVIRAVPEPIRQPATTAQEIYSRCIEETPGTVDQLNKTCSKLAGVEL